MPFIVDRNMRESCVDSLRKMDEKIIFSENCNWVYSPVNTHPDLQIHFVSDKEAFVPPELFEYYKSILPDYVKLKQGKKSLGGTYPENVAYNIARIGNNIVAGKSADENIIEYYRTKGCRIVEVKQGYTKCNICSDGISAVTEDCGIYKALSENGIKTLLIPVGSVALEGFSNGFIGGASGFKNGRILLCGEAEIQIRKMISDFFALNGREVICLDNGKLTDYGSVLYF